MGDDQRLQSFYFLSYLAIVACTYLLGTGFSLELKPWPFVKAAFGSLGGTFFVVVFVRRYLWRNEAFRAIVGIKTPDIHGRWEGHIRSSHTKHNVQHRVAVEFWQTLGQINVWYYDDNAVTHSLLAGFAAEPEGGPMRLYCLYHNQPVRTEDKKRLAHTGVMELFLEPSNKSLIGIYYNNTHQRPTYGEIALRYVGRRTLGRL